jgi:hypothetical protein
VVPSVVPSDKNFSTVLFLTLVHGSASFNQLKAGQDHLQQHLMLQSSRRENLVRTHFGLFVQCAEGLEFLKAFRKGGALTLLLLCSKTEGLRCVHQKAFESLGYSKNLLPIVRAS